MRMPSVGEEVGAGARGPPAATGTPPPPLPAASPLTPATWTIWTTAPQTQRYR